MTRTYDEAGFYVDQKLICCVQYKLLNEQRQVKLPENYSPSNQYSDCYALGLLNSKLLLYYYRTVLFNGLSILPEHIRRIPVHRINFENQAEKRLTTKLQNWSKNACLAKERQAVRPEDNLDHARNLDRQIKDINSEIDKRVFKLYGLE
ncbi:MAG: hypothetical protein IPP55_15525 [Anaerolineales bacterium]|nr:hypothetical protein [Anaerolineales bacterium]